MRVTVQPGTPSGKALVPASKSHTIRALIIGTAAEGVSTIRAPLDSGDTASCVRVCRELGATIIETRGDRGELELLTVEGTGGNVRAPREPLDCANSGTTLYLATGLASLASAPVTFTGDEQLRQRPVKPLLSALARLGAGYEWGGHRGTPPFTVTGPLRGGATSIKAITSQYLSSLLLAAPLAPEVTQIQVPLLNERPYVEMTLAWLDRQGIRYQNHGFTEIEVAPNQRYHGFDARIAADFSSATFLLVAAAITGATLELIGLDPDDSQGDREVLTVLAAQGCTVEHTAHGVRITGPAGGHLAGGEVDLNAMPDALPALAVAGARCAEPLRLVNVPQAREKETDRISVMAEELGRLGVATEELADGLVIYPSTVRGATVDSHADHRVAMALTVAGLVAAAPVTVERAEVAGITYPGFYATVRSLGIRVA